MAIASDRVDDEMLQKPLRWDIKFIRKFMLVFGLISSFFDYVTFAVLLYLKASVSESRTGWFIESVISATLIVLVVRTFKPFFRSMPSLPLAMMVFWIVGLTLFLPFLPFSSLMGFVAIQPEIYLAILVIAAFYIPYVEIAKRQFYKKNKLH
jgi:P-type Mg2+ transporter